jgi:hypothetical protein
MPYNPHEVCLCAILTQNNCVFLPSPGRPSVPILRVEPCPPMLVPFCYVVSTARWASRSAWLPLSTLNDTSPLLILPCGTCWLSASLNSRQDMPTPMTPSTSAMTPGSHSG